MNPVYPPLPPRPMAEGGRLRGAAAMAVPLAVARAVGDAAGPLLGDARGRGLDVIGRTFPRLDFGSPTHECDQQLLRAFSAPGGRSAAPDRAAARRYRCKTSQ